MAKLLKDYDFPKDLKTMSIDEMDLLSYGIREFLIENVSKTGGHLAPNLGVVELTMALHKVFDSPKDKLIWDVGHQSYVHKILTNRSEEFTTLRKYKGLSGFPKVKESIHDIFDTGHSSTSISIAAGMAAARDIKGGKEDIIAIIGDGSMTGGLAFEALNNLGTSGNKVIVVLNDNGMSISPNIGGISQHLGNLRTSKSYLKTKNALKKVASIPAIGNGIYSGLRNTKEQLKYALMPGGIIFEELGFTYIGPVDGHNLEELIDVFERTKNLNGPILVHAITTKGKGYRSAEANPNKFHGIGPFNPCSGEVSSSSQKTYSDVSSEMFLELAENDSKIVCISAAMCEATGLYPFSQKYPDRFFDVGIAEAHGVTFAAGLAAGGMRPIVAIYSTFLQRAYDQILEDVCLMNLPVIFAIDRAGAVGADGETHNGMYDISYLSSMPNMTIFTPSDEVSLKAAFREAYKLNSPVAIRYPRGTCNIVPDNVNSSTEFHNERACSGTDVDILACGRMVEKAYKVREILEDKGISVGITKIHVVKPLNIYSDSKIIVTLEDGTIDGGFGERVASQLNHKSVLTLGWPDKFIEHGDIGSLEKQFNLDHESIAERIIKELEK